MTYEDIEKLCPKAERITITPDGTVGLKVGEFAQAVNIPFHKGHEAAERQVKDLYLDLLAMNREQADQIASAQKNL